MAHVRTQAGQDKDMQCEDNGLMFNIKSKSKYQASKRKQGNTR